MCVCVCVCVRVRVYMRVFVLCARVFMCICFLLLNINLFFPHKHTAHSVITTRHNDYLCSSNNLSTSETTLYLKTTTPFFHMLLSCKKTK